MNSNLFLLLALEITNACDKACKMCCASTEEPKIGKHMPFDELQKLVDRIISLGFSRIRIGITGGEPFLYRSQGKTLLDVVVMLKRLEPVEISIQTSGVGPGVTDFRNQVLSIVNSAVPVKVTLSSSYTVYQRIGIDERMKETIEVLTEISAPEILQIFLTSTANDWNKTIGAFENLVDGLGFDVWQIRQDVLFCKRNDRLLLARGASIVGVGKAKKWKNVGFKSNPDDLESGCMWLSPERRTMQVLTNGNVQICCDPAAYGNETYICNCFEEDPELYFKRYPRLRSHLIKVIKAKTVGNTNIGKCGRCNMVNHRTL